MEVRTRIAKAEEEKRLVYGEVYAPGRPDVQGEFMDAEAIEYMAHDFMRRQMNKAIDIQHDNRVVNGLTIVESFIARDGDPDFIPGSWVVCCHVDDDDTWAKVKSGELNGFSVEALVLKEDEEVEVEIPPVVKGTTSTVSGHSHQFSVNFGPDGAFKGGMTTLANGHTHRIVGGTITEEAQGHRHRFSSIDNIVIAGQ